MTVEAFADSAFEEPTQDIFYPEDSLVLKAMAAIPIFGSFCTIKQCDSLERKYLQTKEIKERTTILNIAQEYLVASIVRSVALLAIGVTAALFVSAAAYFIAGFSIFAMIDVIYFVDLTYRFCSEKEKLSQFNSFNDIELYLYQ